MTENKKCGFLLFYSISLCDKNEVFKNLQELNLVIIKSLFQLFSIINGNYAYTSSTYINSKKKKKEKPVKKC